MAFSLFTKPVFESWLQKNRFKQSNIKHLCLQEPEDETCHDLIVGSALASE